MSSRAEDEAATEQAAREQLDREPAEQRAETLRRELDVLLGELRTRGKRAFDLRYQMRQHPAIVAGAGAVVLAGVGLVVAQMVRRQRRKRSVRARLSALSALVQERAAAGITAARTGAVGRRRRRREQEPGNIGPLVKAAIGIALPRLLPLLIGKLLKGGGLARPRPALVAGNGNATPARSQS
jgi:hypothetical protein